MDVKVTLTPAPPPPPPPEAKPAPPEPVAPPSDLAPVTIDLPSFIEKNYVGRAPGKTSPLACATTGDATLVQLHEPLAEHTHADGDEFLYVIAGEGSARAREGSAPAARRRAVAGAPRDAARGHRQRPEPAGHDLDQARRALHGRLVA